MERTPSPSRRVHTPPAPLHGVKFDSYEPYSPRRSSRVAAQRGQSSQTTSPTSSRYPRTARQTTPTISKRKVAARISDQTLSPPSSPASPYQHRSPRSTRRVHLEAGVVDSDSDHHIAPTPSRRHLSAMDTRGMLPTPAKTPRKRAVPSQEELSSTARVLFQPRPATIEEAMPTPRKRKIRKDIYTLESFMNQGNEDEEKIPIYTDSKERIPELDEGEENPFVTKKGKGKGKASGTSKARKVDERTAQMEEAVNRDEGLIYTFRGKKIFRKFHDDNPSAGSDALEFSGDEVRRRAGHEAHKPLTRSSIKPRKLFQAEIDQRNRELDPDDADEEAITDIEVSVATPSRRKVGMSGQEATPPPTTRVKRQISFESWQRVKHSSGPSASNKRSGSPLESGPDKRTRSEPSSSMSLD